MKPQHARIAMAAMVSLAFGAIGARAAEVETKDPIKILFINSSDGDFIGAVYGEVLKEAGYNVKYVPGDYVAGYTAVATGDIDVSLAAWQTTGVDLTKEALASGKVTNHGPTGVKVTEGWWYNGAAKKACPGLPKWEALKEEACAKALATAETAPKGRYLDAPADWGTASDKRIEELGLNLALVNSGSAASLVASVKGSIDRGEPSLSWGYLPHWMFSKTEGDFVELPGFSRDLDILKLGHNPTLDKAKIAAGILKALTIDASAVAVATDAIDNGGKTPEATAREWMAANEKVWKTWLPK